MKFGEYLQSQKVQAWDASYLDYNRLKTMIKELETQHLSHYSQDLGKGTSLSVPRPTNAAGVPEENAVTQEQFYSFLENEMRKIELFTKAQVKGIRQVLSEVEAQTSLPSFSSKQDEKMTAILRQRVEAAGFDFLRLEKFVNLNFTGFHKILKKHDRRLPNPCKAFYTTRLHDQSWVRGDYSDVMVKMSKVYSSLRGDEKVEEKESAAQNFVRSTRKYWVHTEDISSIKYTVLQHLPVFLQKAMGGETDSQLVNSVYLDNYSMELYHGRLDKTPGAIALRLRWYGTGQPDVVFVERKTHRESWAGEVSVKERFTIKENQVLSLMDGTFDIEAEINKLKAKGKSEELIQEYRELASDCLQTIVSKQLVPTMRTQYMRTAFQIPFDATVRVSLDTNLCMISERTKDTVNGIAWYRNPSEPVPTNEITRFPHAVLEVKLQLEDDNSTPEWVTDVLASGKLLQVHKFSKFIHGGAVLMPDDVRAVPYWIDDSTLVSSITQSGADRLLKKSPGANSIYAQLLPHDADGKVKQRPLVGGLIMDEEKGGLAPREVRGNLAPRNLQLTRQGSMAGETVCWSQASASSIGGRGGGAGAAAAAAAQNYDSACYSPGGGETDEMTWTSECCDWSGHWEASHMTTQKIEPKLFFANERTFIKWLHMGVIISSIAVGVLAFSDKSSQAQEFALLMLPVSLAFIIYATVIYLWRSDMIRTRDTSRWDDPYGPVILTVGLIIALIGEFIMRLLDIMEEFDSNSSGSGSSSIIR